MNSPFPLTFLVSTWCVLLASRCQASEPPRADTAHWSLRPRSTLAIPQFESARDREWVRTPVDAFVLAKLKSKGLAPAPAADRRVLIRRLNYDLLGLPPAPEDIAAFENDRSPDAYERLVDRLLASPQYGERWGRHWLDVVRFAETEGFEYDRERPGAWRYRDYVIGSFNADKPYDRFVQEQLAGDELDGANQDLQIAAGFHRLGPVRRNAGNAEVSSSRNEILTERTDILGAVFLGLTIGCARCHDHKFDDIPQADYYHLQAFLAATEDQDIVLASPLAAAEWKARAEPAQKEVRRLTQALMKATGEEEIHLKAQLQAARQRLPEPLPSISSIRDGATPTPIHILKRGDSNNKGPQVGPRLLTALLSDSSPEYPAQVARPRSILASWLTTPDHPLTARVVVNRIWQHHFGTGLVGTPNDFGINGEAPSHPELLDFLANAFVAGQWRWKPLHRLIVSSSTYRQASQAMDPHAAHTQDPANRLLGHFGRRRLSAEEIRDSLQSFTGSLFTKAGGPSVVPGMDRDLVNLLYDPSQWHVTEDAREQHRRSVYLIAKRNLRMPFLEIFDQPDVQTSCASRQSSTHAPQALELLNGSTTNQAARAFAERLRREAGNDRTRQIERAFALATGRDPTPGERKLAEAFLVEQPLEEFALAVFNLNAFLYVD